MNLIKNHNSLIIQKDGSAYLKHLKVKKKNIFLIKSYETNINWKIKKYVKKK